MGGSSGFETEALSGPHIFLSYRRDDSSGYAGHLYERLTERFGQPNVFMDIDSLAPGVDFLEAIHQTLDGCDTVLVLIGRGWLDASDREGLRRLENPNDFVRLEIEAALSGNHRVIPVLVSGAEMPLESELPESILSLARRHDPKDKQSAEALIASAAVSVDYPGPDAPWGAERVVHLLVRHHHLRPAGGGARGL